MGAYSAWIETNTGRQPAHAGDGSLAFIRDSISRKLNCLLDVHNIFNGSWVSIIKTEKHTLQERTFSILDTTTEDFIFRSREREHLHITIVHTNLRVQNCSPGAQGWKEAAKD